MSGFEATVRQLTDRGFDRFEAERQVRAQLHLEPSLPPTPTRDERMLEKDEQIEIRKIAIAFGFKVRNLSQYRPSKISVGYPDLHLTHKRLPLMLFWETKRQVGGELSPAQQEFRDDCIRCNERHGSGDRYAFVEKLLELEIAVRGPGVYGIEPLRHLTNAG